VHTFGVEDFDPEVTLSVAAAVSLNPRRLEESRPIRTSTTNPTGGPKDCRKGGVAAWGHGNGRKAADGCRAGSVPRRPGWNFVPVAIPERRSCRVPSRSAR